MQLFKIEEDLNSSDSGSEEDDDVNVTSDEDEPYQVLNTSQYRKQNQSSWLNRGNVVQLVKQFIMYSFRMHFTLLRLVPGR